MQVYYGNYITFIFWNDIILLCKINVQAERKKYRVGISQHIIPSMHIIFVKTKREREKKKRERERRIEESEEWGEFQKGSCNEV